MKCGRDAALSRHDSGPGVEHIEMSASAGVPQEVMSLLPADYLSFDGLSKSGDPVMLVRLVDFSTLWSH